MKKLFLAFGLTSILTLSGCVQMPPLNFSVTDIEFSKDKIDADLKAVNVSFATDSEKTGDLDIQLLNDPRDSSSNFRSTFKDSLEEALHSSGIFLPSSNIKVGVQAKITKFQTPSFSTTFKTDMDVDYRIRNLNDGQIIYEKTITSSGEVNLGYAFTGTLRWAEARNRACQNNIREFISDLKQFVIQNEIKQDKK